MKLREYNQVTLPTQRPQAPAISYQAVGSWFLNQDLCELMGLEPGDTVCFHMDEEHPLDWYLSKGPNGYPVRRPKGKAAGLLISSMALRTEFLAAYKAHMREDALPAAKMMVSRTPVEQGERLLYPILTGSMTDRGRGRRTKKH